MVPTRYDAAPALAALVDAALLYVPRDLDPDDWEVEGQCNALVMLRQLIDCFSPSLGVVVAAPFLSRLVSTICDQEIIILEAVELLLALAGNPAMGAWLEGLSVATRIATTLVTSAAAGSMCSIVVSRLVMCMCRLRQYDGLDRLRRVPGLRQVLQRVGVLPFPKRKGRRAARSLLRLLAYPSNPVACERAVAQAVLQRLSSVNAPATCGICQDDADCALLVTPCGHAFHGACLEVWVLKLYAVDADGEVSGDDDDDESDADGEPAELAHVNGCPMCRSDFVVRRERNAWD